MPTEENSSRGRESGATGPSTEWPPRDAFPGDPTQTDAIYRWIISWGALLVRTYHRVEIVGERFPESTPTLLVQNHTNGLCDAHILMCTTGRPLRILVKYKLITAPFIGWMLRRARAVPVYRRKDGVDTRKNAQSFEAIDQALRDGAVVALFPEGESLNSIGLRPIKSGVARMAASAELSSPGGLGLQVVPIGVTYEDRDRLRGLASTVIGRPIDVAPFLENADGEATREQIQDILAAVTEGMKGLILHAENQDEHDAAVALERLLPQGGAPLGVRRQRALEALRADTSPQAEERRQAVCTLGSRFAAARLTGDDVLAESPGAVAAYGAYVTALPVLAFGLPFWIPISCLAIFISKFPKTPDKMVTLRVLFGYLGNILVIPAAVVIGALIAGANGASPWIGAAAAYAAYWVARKSFVPALDRWLAAKACRNRRALDGEEGELTSLRSSLSSIREAYAATAE